MGYINDLDAIRRSSNVYMAEISMRLAEVNRSTNQWPRLGEAHNDLRQHYAQFGLGTETGIDLPRESSGLIGTSNSGNLLYLSFGQYDTYTPLQLGQFSATMANGGERMRTRLVRDVLEPSMENGTAGSSIRHYAPEVMNTVSNTNADFQRMQEGMRQVVAVSGQTGGTAYDDFNGSNSTDYSLAAKTGTAQTTVNGMELNNQTMVAYAPYDNPEIAVAVIVPSVALDDHGNNSGIANTMAREAMNLFF
ncbi:cell division protein FtsI [Geomicrobium sp. JCM 19039]|nr:cell division protein FtsI [Geomicrobium sp. JCM 19039]